MNRRAAVLLAGALLTLCSPSSSTAQAGSTTQSRTLRYTVPHGWRIEQPRSSMRLAQFVLPRAAGDREDATAALFYFGQGQGGSVEANLQRWAAQMTQPNGKPGTVASGKTSTFTTHGLAITMLDIGGSYTGDGMMGGAGSQATAKPGYHLKAVVVDTPGGRYFLKVTGPAATVRRWDASLVTFLETLRYE